MSLAQVGQEAGDDLEIEIPSEQEGGEGLDTASISEEDVFDEDEEELRPPQRL